MALTNEQLRAIHAKAAGRGPIRRFLVRHPGARHSLMRGALVGGAAAALVGAGLYNRRLARRAFNEVRDLRASRAMLGRAAPAGARARFLAGTKRRVRFWHQRGMPELGRKVVRHRWRRTPAPESAGIRAFKRAIEGDMKAARARALLHAERIPRLAKWGGIPVGVGGAGWALMPAGEELGRRAGRREARREPPTMIYVKRRRRAA